METGTLEKKLAKLPDDLKLKVEGYIDALLAENNIHKPVVLADPKQPNETPKFEIKPGFGGGKGIIGYMADDFDAPLEEFKDYM